MRDTVVGTLPNHPNGTMGHSHSSESGQRKNASQPMSGRELGVYRVLLDNQTNTRVVVVMHSTPLTMVSRVPSSSAAQAPATAAAADAHAGAVAPATTEIPPHVYPLAPKLDDSVPAPLALPFQMQTTITTLYNPCGEATVLVSVFTLGDDCVDGYLYLNQPFVCTPDFLANAQSSKKIAKLIRKHQKKLNKQHKKQQKQMHAAGAVTADVLSLDVKISMSDLARRCKLDRPIGQLDFLAFVSATSYPASSSSVTQPNPNVLMMETVAPPSTAVTLDSPLVMKSPVHPVTPVTISLPEPLAAHK